MPSGIEHLELVASFRRALGLCLCGLPIHEGGMDGARNGRIGRRRDLSIMSQERRISTDACVVLAKLYGGDLGCINLQIVPTISAVVLLWWLTMEAQRLELARNLIQILTLVFSLTTFNL